MVEIRPMQTGDIESFLTWRGGDAYKDEIVRSEMALHEVGARVIYLAVAGERLAGTAQFVSRHADPDLGDGVTTAYLQALEVIPAYRRQGIATRLIQAVESEARWRGCHRLTLMVEPDNVQAKQLYHALGFSFFKTSTDLWRGREYPVECLEKALSDE